MLDGEFEVMKKSNHQDIVIAVREAGEVFGEMALIDQSPRTATVRALRESKVLRIGGETFKQLLAQSPSASLSILRNGQPAAEAERSAAYGRTRRWPRWVHWLPGWPMS